VPAKAKRLDTRSRAEIGLKLQGARLRLALRNLLSDGDDQRFVKDSKQFFINLALTRFIVPVSILQSSASAL
jgi:hypothetical protein